MIFTQKMRNAELRLGVSTLDDWTDIPPSWILNIDGCGPATLNRIRLFLASSNRTLKGDGTAAHWLQKFADTRIAANMESDYRIPTPYTVIIDAMEQHPFAFDSITADRSRWNADISYLHKQDLLEPHEVKYAVATTVRALGESRGDYSLDGFEGAVHVERKSREDAQGTILGWAWIDADGRTHDRRERFVRELEFLAGVQCAAIVVECPLDELILSVGSRGKKSAAENQKILFRQILSWQQDYRVPWLFCGSRAMAEHATFRILDRFFRKEKEKSKQVTKHVQRELATL